MCVASDTCDTVLNCAKNVLCSEALNVEDCVIKCVMSCSRQYCLPALCSVGLA